MPGLFEYPQAFVLTMAKGQVVRVIVHADGTVKGRRRATDKAQALFPDDLENGVWAFCEYPLHWRGNNPPAEFAEIIYPTEKAE
jgi:hypothetical protein|tara:strand:- start:1619 stop:1870 length:252 start_codon:yes stop_codon:yes gene_type:complete